jgi:hypothetical protein
MWQHGSNASLNLRDGGSTHPAEQAPKAQLQSAQWPWASSGRLAEHKRVGNTSGWTAQRAPEPATRISTGTQALHGFSSVEAWQTL